MKLAADLSREIACGFNPVCGVDEVGRGPWAGPIVAGAVILTADHGVDGIADSKALSRPERERICALLHQRVALGIGIVDVAELDRIGLTAANDLAMARAISALPVRADYALVDGKRMPKGLPVACEAIIKGDAKSLSIAAASIVAKVTRDHLMADLARAHPHYGWETNAGYGTRAHQQGLAAHGITPHHRRSFKPIAEFLLQEQHIES
jgi:ribonuclease HII